MSLKKISKAQPELFEFTSENFQKAKIEISKYPKEKKASAVMALLYLVQNQNDNWIPLAGIKYIASLLNIPYIKVYEVVTFYSMFNLQPSGDHFVQVCGTTPCWLRGAENIKKACKDYIGQEREVTKDGLCWIEVECLGACVNAPMIQINDDYYEDLDYESTVKILKDIKNKKNIIKGSQIGRKSSEPLERD